MILRNAWLGVNTLRGEVSSAASLHYWDHCCWHSFRSLFRPFERPWFGWYLLLTGPVSILGLILGMIGKDSPRVVGVVLSGSMLFVLIRCAASLQALG
jgi:hypothetical protein